MNGNMTEDTYQNFLVIQDDEGTVEEQLIIDIYASKIIVDDTIIIVGGYYDTKEDNWYKKIIKYNLATDDVFEPIYDIGFEYTDTLLFDDKIYCITSDMNASKQGVDIIDINTLDNLSNSTYSDEVGGIAEIDNLIYVITARKIFTADSSNLSEIDVVYEFESKDTIEDKIKRLIKAECLSLKNE